MNITEEKIERFLLSPPFGIKIRQITALAFLTGFIAGLVFAAILIYSL